MTNEEISNIVNLATKKILESNKEIITQNLSSLTILTKYDDDFKKALLSLFTSAVELGAMTSIRALADLGCLNILE